jgi:hypothetical protein
MSAADASDFARPKSETNAVPDRSIRMCSGERLGDLTPDRHCPIDRQPAFAAQDAVQILAVHESHREELETFDFAKIVDAEDVLVRDLRPEEQLLFEPLYCGSIGHEPGANDLDRDHPVEFAIVGLVDAAHAAFAEQGLDVVAGAQLRAWLDVNAPRGL